MTTPNNHMLFGIPGDDLEAASRRLEAIFGFSMDPIASDSWGDYYSWDEYVPETDDYVAEVSVYQNRSEDEDGEYFHRPAYSDFPLLIEVLDVEDQDAYERAILSDPVLKAKRLKREVFRDGPDGKVIVDEFKD